MPQADQTSESLLQRVRDWGDEASWRQFFLTYSRIIYSVAYKAGLTPAEADDIVQATMMGVADRIRDFRYSREKGSFKGWICNQANSRICDHLRRRHREEEIFRLQPSRATHARTSTVERFPDSRNDPEMFLHRNWNEAVAETALARIKTRVKPKHFQIFDLAAIKQWPLERISRTLGVNVGQVYLVKSRISFLLKRETRRVEAQLEQLPSPGITSLNQPRETV